MKKKKVIAFILISATVMALGELYYKRGKKIQNVSTSIEMRKLEDVISYRNNGITLKIAKVDDKKIKYQFQYVQIDTKTAEVLADIGVDGVAEICSDREFMVFRPSKDGEKRYLFTQSDGKILLESNKGYKKEFKKE